MCLIRISARRLITVQLLATGNEEELKNHPKCRQFLGKEMSIWKKAIFETAHRKGCTGSWG